jgi:hypothetical protein
MCLFSSIQPGLPFYAAYPPFGIVTLCFLGISSYILLVGMLGIAVNLSRDVGLRREIYRSLEADSHMMKMGLAEMQGDIERKILPLVNRIDSVDETRGYTEPNEEDVKLMIKEVLEEIRSVQPNIKSGEPRE